jgi:hypothetical protein
VSCKWVKQQGPTKGFDFNESKVEQIFNLLLREKQLKLLEGHKFPTAQELQGRPYCKWHHLFTTPPMTAKSSVDKFNQLLSRPIDLGAVHHES